MYVYIYSANDFLFLLQTSLYLSQISLTILVKVSKIDWPYMVWILHPQP